MRISTATVRISKVYAESGTAIAGSLLEVLSRETSRGKTGLSCGVEKLES